ncbi:hypothetical protein RhiirA5_434052 [Rhizophagus irregularis]|uniref:DNA-directed DNA polymerase n=1 Tax=Rhizophagus irregularis TaxID=588596 RepID=A0A2N0NQR4_9GLOM|nr:hypothetical protein RhiirA5_434052 [Rhizophagus irregularis]
MHTPTISDQTDHTRTTPALRYDSASSLTSIILCNDIVSEFDNGMTDVLQQRLSDKQPIHFMPTAINGQKAIVNIMGIKPFFDVVISEEISLSMFKTKLVKMVSNILGSTSKTWNHWDQNKALKAVHEVGISTASDNLNPTYYYRKVACEERLPLSSWATLRGTYLFQVSVNNYNPTSEDDYNNPLFSSALLRDRTLVLTWDIETYSSLGLGKFPTAQNDESNYYGKALKETNATTDEQIREVAEYCIIDAISCQQLMVKCNAINEYREVVSVAFISLYDSHYFAVEMKVRNLLSAVLFFLNVHSKYYFQKCISSSGYFDRYEHLKKYKV